MLLDVGCGSRPKGDVNVDFFRGGWNKQEADQDRGEFVNPKDIPNYVVASAEYLPFNRGVFDVAYSSHTIEHVPNPFQMLSELARVSRRKVIVKCPHRSGSGGKRPFHINFFDEAWFNFAASKLGYPAKTFISVFDDGPMTSRLLQIAPKPFKRFFSRNIPYRVVRKFERKIFGNAKLPLEVETHLTKEGYSSKSDPTIFVVVYNDVETYAKCFQSGAGIDRIKVVGFNNICGLGLGFAYNDLAMPFLNQNAWLVFCHQDFILNKSLDGKLFGLNKLGVYGVIGSRLGTVGLLGEIVQTDGSTIGTRLSGPTPVDALDEMCLIAHTEALRCGLRFDDRFTFHYYGADLCLQARRLGFDVMALQIDCQHKSKSLSGAVKSQCYRDLQGAFRSKWVGLLPLATTTGVLK